MCRSHSKKECRRRKEIPRPLDFFERRTFDSDFRLLGSNLFSATVFYLPLPLLALSMAAMS